MEYKGPLYSPSLPSPDQGSFGGSILYRNIPAELRQLRQWVCAGPDKNLLNPRTGRQADVTDSSSWGSFEEAVNARQKFVGFVFTESDPYAVIDLDNKPDRPLNPEQIRLHQHLLEEFETYTERSAGGLGYHIICKGTLPSGVNNRHASLEMYSSGRYMIFTGNVVRPAPIADCQAGLDKLYDLHKSVEPVELEDVEGILDDRDLVDMAMRAANAEKFNKLCSGDWQNDYPSQSEADFALLAILAYYTRDNEQVRRVFRMSALGKRDKAIKDDVYLNRCLAKIRAVQPTLVDLSVILKNGSDQAFASMGISTGGPSVTPLPEKHAITSPATSQNVDPVARLTGIEPPPGLIGEIAQYFYSTSVRPVPEISLSAAIALVAGVVGRSYNISGTGLNQYLIVLAQTGSGKEGAARAIDNLITAVRPTVPMIDQFIGPSAFASGQALIRILDERPCFISVLGEFGITLQQLCSADANAAQLMLKKALLDLYAKSGFTSVLRESAYSDKEKTTKVVQAPNVTILAESTPETFFEGLDASHIAEGLIPRFSVIEYTGHRVARNPNAGFPPSPELVKAFSDLVVTALSTTNNGTFCPIDVEPAALEILDAFDKEADKKINDAGSDVEKQLWNRAHLKALKLAGLVAVGVNHTHPVVSRPMAAWSIDFTRRDIGVVSTRYSKGDVGRGASKMENDLRRIIVDYFKMGPEKAKGYYVDEKMYTDRIIPYGYLQRRTANLSAFKNSRLGAVRALKEILESMCDSGSLSIVPPTKMSNIYKSTSVAYFVLGSSWRLE